MIIAVKLKDGIIREYRNVRDCYITRELPNLLQIRCGYTSYFYNMDSVEYYQAIYEEGDK